MHRKLEKSLYMNFLSEICISDVPRLHLLNERVTSPLPSNQSIDFLDEKLRWGELGGRPAAQLWEYKPLLCRTAAELPPPELPDSPEEETRRRKGL